MAPKRLLAVEAFLEHPAAWEIAILLDVYNLRLSTFGIYHGIYTGIYHGIYHGTYHGIYHGMYHGIYHGIYQCIYHGIYQRCSTEGCTHPTK